MGDIISYAVLALDKNKVDEVIMTLERDKRCSAINQWLKSNKYRVYGEFSEDWRPFGCDTIQEIIEKSSDNYHSETHLIDNYLEHYPVPINLSHINVFFIDLFSMYLKKYYDLARMSDQAFCSAEKNSCCFLIDYNLPDDVQKELEHIYQLAWPLVSTEYNEGCLHRMAARIDDLNNFKNYLKIKKVNQDSPNPQQREAVKELISKKTGERFENKPRPTL